MKGACDKRWMGRKARVSLDLRSDKTEYLTDDEILAFFEPSNQMDAITRIRNTYIIGHKGSGKSFLLRYLSLPLQLRRKQSENEIEFDKHAIGIWIPCNAGKFGGMTEDQKNPSLDKAWVKTFTHMFNLSVLKVLLDSLGLIYRESKSIETSEIIDFIKTCFHDLNLTISKISYENALQLIDDEISKIQGEYGNEVLNNPDRYYSDHVFLFNLRKNFQKCFKKLQKIEPVFLLDEYNELSNGQQKIINEMIRIRQPVFKMTSLPKGYVVDRLKEGEQTDIDQDFELVDLANKPLTPKSKELPALRSFLLNVLTKRLQTTTTFNRKIINILEEPKPVTKTSKKRTRSEIQKINEQNYCGFTNYVMISSSNPKSFLDMMQATIKRAQEKNIDVTKKPIPTRIQLESIREYSIARRREVVQSDPKFGRHLMRMVEYLGKYLRTKTENSGDNHRLFAIKDPENLNEIPYSTIEIGLKKSWIIQNDLGRVSKNERVRLDTMTLNNVLLPAFEVPLAGHQVWEMTSDEIEKILFHKEEVSNERSTEEEKSAEIKTKAAPLEAFSILPEIADLIKKDQLILFIGSGLSTYAGLPSAKTLTEVLCKKLDLGIEKIKGLDDVSQYYINDKGETGFATFIKDEFQKTSQTKMDLHKKLFTLKVTKIITTNWDNLIESTLLSLSKPFQIIVNQGQITNYDDHEIGIFKMHGDLEYPTLIVAGKDQYEGYTTSHNFMITKLKSLFQNRSILFIGYSLQDPNFRQIRHLVGNELGTIKPSYVITPEIIAHEKSSLLKKNIKVIESDFTPIINSLVEICAKNK